MSIGSTKQNKDAGGIKVRVVFFSLLRQDFNVRRNIPPWRVRQAHSGSNSPMTPQNVNAKHARKVASIVRFRHIMQNVRQQ